jgi:superfamily II DNA or RNA helicase
MITIKITNNKYCNIITTDYDILSELDKEFSFKLQGVEYTQAYKQGWDGRTRLLIQKNGKVFLPLGLLEKLKLFLLKMGWDSSVEDERPEIVLAPEIDLKLKLEALQTPLRDYQEKIVKVAFDHKKGIIRSCTGSGKTLSISALVAKINKPTIIYVIGLDLLGQFHETLTQLFDEPIGYIGNGVCDIHRINVASIWTIGRTLGMKNNIIDDDGGSEKEILKAENSKAIIDLLKSASNHIFDECHVVGCDTIKHIYKAIDPERIYGFSGTPFRSDGSDLQSTGILGDQIINVSASELIEKGFLAKPLIKFVPAPATYSRAKDYHSVYKECIVENEPRNKLIVESTQMLLGKGYRVLVLFKQIKHGKILKQMFDNINIEIEMLYGNDTLKTRDEVKEKLENGKLKAILASNIFDVGINLPSLSGLVLAGSGKSPIRCLQRVGRILRKYEGKPTVAVIDFADDAKYLKQHSKSRYETYKSEDGFIVKW